jgi:protein-S-isoprenylcysteine O-methyltransferase Ste14
MAEIISASQTPLNKYGYNSIAQHITTAIITAVALFIGASTLGWTWGWVFSFATLAGWVGMSVVLVRANPELLNERGKRARSLEHTKRWDWVILSVYAVLVLVLPFVAGLDYRYGWSGPTPDAIKWLGIVLLLASFALLTWAMAANRFFEKTVRIQEKRGHQVATTGPYRYVRHPGYAAVILQFIATPLALGTWAALIPAGLGIALFVIRTALEDRTLQAELPGYTDFARQTRFRLLPGLW